MSHGNPLLGNRMQLFCRTNQFLAVYPDGSVKGTQDRDDPHTHLEIIPANFPGHVRILGTRSGAYVAMNAEGKLHGQLVADEETVFVERFQGSYNTYLWAKNAERNWFIGIKGNGKAKRGPKTKYGEKAIQFLPNRTPFE